VLKFYGWTADLLEAALNGRRIPCVGLKVSVELEALRINSLFHLNNVVITSDDGPLRPFLEASALPIV
jgi:hypothetical protein